MNATLEAWVFGCSLLFLASMLLVVGSAVPAVQRRFPRVLLVGFLLAIASFALVLVGAWLLG